MVLLSTFSNYICRITAVGLSHMSLKVTSECIFGKLDYSLIGEGLRDRTVQFQIFRDRPVMSSLETVVMHYDPLNRNAFQKEQTTRRAMSKPNWRDIVTFTVRITLAAPTAPTAPIAPTAPTTPLQNSHSAL